MRKKFVFVSTAMLMYAIFLWGCVYHKSDQEYPAPLTCDTVNVRYNVEIKSILDEHCATCHSGSNSITGIDLYDHSVISFFALDGQFTYGTLLSAVMHEGGAPEMPDGGPKLQDCEINKIAAWVHDGAPDN